MKKSVWIIVGIITVLLIGYLVMKAPSYFVKNQVNDAVNNAQDKISSLQTPMPQGYSVEISGYAFKSASLTINVGDTVIWTNKDSIKHTITSDTGTELDSELLGNGETYSYTFNTAGTYNYHCTPHPSMKGTIVVQ